MKIEINDSQRADITAAITKTDAAVSSLRETQSRIDAIASEQEASARKEAAILAVEIPTEKQVADLLVATKRVTILGALIQKTNQQLDAHKVATINAVHVANELLRRVAGAKLIEETKQQLVESLPPSVRKNGHLVLSVWSGSAENRMAGAFLNPSPPTRRDDSETIISAAESVIQRLRALLAGDDLSISAQHAAA
jgi:cell division protein ZapA (FtsZ GTPase activity inhibitor)